MAASHINQPLYAIDFVGGISGIFLTLIISDLITSLGMRMTGIAMGQPIRIVIDLSLAAFALIFSSVICMLFGVTEGFLNHAVDTCTNS
ncbi:MAG: hypothetical protein QME59_01010 [Candidatus Hydrothermarchaeota archaeon]|nr:hypothetical protein [Candidatus Hydrothermarchaeota archaeon]